MHVSTRSLQIDYDIESDTLYLYSAKDRATRSVTFGNLNLDFGKDGSVIGLEFLDATATLPPLLLVTPKQLFKDKKLLKPEVLEKIKNAHVSLETAANFVVISFWLEFDNAILEEELECKLTLPTATQNQLRIAQKIARS